MKVSTCSHRPVLTPCSLSNLDYQVDPYVGCEHYCCYCYALDEAETDWTQEILIHEDISGQLHNELAHVPPQKIYMGYKTDPYQPCEAAHYQTRQVLELFLKKGFSASILTKSDLVVRDTDLLKEMDGASVSVSVAFNDNTVRRLFEDNTIDTEARIEALSRLKEAGISTNALICPVIPFITDIEPLIDALAPFAGVIWIYGLSIVDSSVRNRQNIEQILTHSFPHRKEQIESIVLAKDHPYWTKLRGDLAELEKAKEVNLNIHV